MNDDALFSDKRNLIPFICVSFRFVNNDDARTTGALLSERIVSFVSKTSEPSVCSNCKLSSTQLLFM